MHIDENGNLNTEVYPKPTVTDQYLLFDSHYLVEHKFAVIRTLQHWVENAPSKPEGKEKEHTHLKKTLKPNWAFINSAKMHRREGLTPTLGKQNDKRNNTVIHCLSGLSEKLKRILFTHDIPVYFRPSNTLRQKLVNPKEKIPKHKLNKIAA